MQVTSALPMLASAELDIFDADQRSRIPAAAGVAATTLAGLPVPKPAADVMRESILACRRPELPPLTSRATAVLVEIATMRTENEDPKYDKFLGYLANLIWQAGDSKAVLAECAQLLRGVRAEAGE